MSAGTFIEVEPGQYVHLAQVVFVQREDLGKRAVLVLSDGGSVAVSLDALAAPLTVAEVAARLAVSARADVPLAG